MAIPPGPSQSGQSGFTLLEALVALALLGVALLLGMELVLQNPRMVRRMDGERQAFRAMESTLEAVRAGVIPLPLPPPRTAELGGFSTAVGSPARKDLAISMRVDFTALPGLYHVTLRACYTADARKVQKELQTMVWSPPKG
ncbi:MAG TPA: prepilin-type N-terminal cleavage/methylation domain-containing protein [Thermoanaerobaculia bacterium]|jgi:prepilin-type N-terminal cleavage/methylation domain-containing protein|nr:prepilin-type N-terminal cleavage/methylation domain-containing protein [Thermoanaerobaculia bacterium]